MCFHLIDVKLKRVNSQILNQFLIIVCYISYSFYYGNMKTNDFDGKEMRNSWINI
jgi:hypothetical protein